MIPHVVKKYIRFTSHDNKIQYSSRDGDRQYFGNISNLVGIFGSWLKTNATKNFQKCQLCLEPVHTRWLGLIGHYGRVTSWETQDKITHRCYFEFPMCITTLDKKGYKKGVRSQHLTFK